MRVLSPLAFALGTSLAAQGVVWLQQAPTFAPSARHKAGMTFDTARNRILLVGGTDQGGNMLRETWEYDGTTWGLRSPIFQPQAANLRALVYDTLRQRAVLVVPDQDTQLQTWEWNGTTWAVRTPPRAPGNRRDFAVVFDEARGRTVLFGGIATGVPLSDTWEWDGSLWVQRGTGGPPGRSAHAMAYDASRRRVVLFGGTPGSGAFGDTWEWDGTVWFEHFGVAGPQPRSNAGIAFDTGRNVTVLFGGWTNTSGTPRDDVWEWNGLAWTLRVPMTRPPARIDTGFAHDRARGRTVLFGGLAGGSALGDTWEYLSIPNSQARWTAFGQGCIGTSGRAPRLSQQSGTLPILNETFRTEINDLPASPLATPYGIVGGSNTAWGSIQLPFDLGLIGMATCTLYVSVDLVVPIPVQVGVGRWALAIPGEPSLVGQSFFQQCMVVDPGANALSLIVSNAAHAVIGLR